MLVSFVLGVAALGKFGVDALLVLLAVVSGFVGRHALAAGLRLPRHGGRRAGLLAWAGACASVAALAGVALLVAPDRPLLAPLFALLLALAAVSTLVEWKRMDRTAWGEILNMLGLSLVAPLAAYATTGTLTWATFGLWVVSALFFCSSVFHVRYLVRGRVERPGLGSRLRVGAWSVLFHLGALVATLALGLAGAVPVWTWVAMAPNAGKAFWAVARPGRARPSIRRIGFSELAHSLLLLTIAVLVFRVQWEPL